MNQIRQDLGTSCTMMHDLALVGSKWCNKQNVDFGWCKIVHYDIAQKILNESSVNGYPSENQLCIAA